MFKTLFSRRWILATLLVIPAVGVMVRLGIWQLDRLEQRRVFNARVATQLDEPPLELDFDSLGLDLAEMEYRAVVVRGEYDHTQEVAIRNQAWQGRPGVHLLTPLLIAGTDQVVMVDRGWIPLEDFQSGDWIAFAEPGLVQVTGQVRLSQTEPSLGGRPDPAPQPGESLRAWNFVNLPAISGQITYPIISIYIQQTPDETRAELPYRYHPELELTEGPHMGYAVQWFIFATILSVGYPVFVRRDTEKTL